MNNAPIDHLLQPTVPRREPASSSGRPRGDAPPFDTLFRQTNGPPAPPSPPMSKPVPPPAARDSDSRQRPTESDNPPATPTTPSEAAPADSATSKTALDEKAKTATSTDEEQNGEEQVATEATEATEVADAVVVFPAAKQAAEPAAELAVAKEGVQLVDETAAAINESKLKTAAAAQATNADETNAPPVTVETKPVDAETTADPVVAKSSQPAGDAELVAATTVEVPTIELETAEATASDEPKRTSRPTAKSNRGDGVTSDPAHAAKTAADDPKEQSETSVESGGHTNPSASENLDAPAADAPENDGKRAVARIESATDDQPTSSREQSAAPARPAAAPPVPTAVANVQQPSQADAAKPPVTAATGSKPKVDTSGTKEGPLSPFARLERGNTNSTQGNHRTGQGPGTSHVDPARFVSRVARAIHTAQERGGPLQLRLSPPELGAMRLELSVNQGALTATIETENSAARQVLLDNLPALRDRLAEQNVKIERFDVDVRRDGSGQQNPAPQERGDQSRHEHAAHRTNSSRGTTNQTTSEEPAPLRRTITTSSINVIA